MSRNSATFELPKEAVTPTDLALVMSALPAGYRIEGRLGGAYAVYVNGADVCIGTAQIVNGNIVFDIDTNRVNDCEYGKWFLRKVKEKYPDYDEDRILWTVVFRWYAGWSIVGRPSMNKEVALRKVQPFHLDKEPLLCSYRAGDDKGMGFSTVNSFEIDSNGVLSDIDKGPVAIKLTGLESI